MSPRQRRPFAQRARDAVLATLFLATLLAGLTALGILAGGWLA
ncbi:hypothetical protein [Falsiroseomonas selenitidurans]|nr:hypothetical protein [Falsiroseomonas selenitidurans]